jgi:predicted enzyme related to lactoylglutathione lyase
MDTDTEYSQSLVTVMVPDLDEAVSFYSTTLGLRLKARYGKEFAVLEAPGLTIGLHPQSKQDSSPSMSIGLGVESLEAAMERLAARGVKFMGTIVEDPPVRVAYFSGPGGAPLYLCEQSDWR